MMEQLTPHIKKQTTFMREPLEVAFNLTATLRLLSSYWKFLSQSTVQLQS